MKSFLKPHYGWLIPAFAWCFSACTSAQEKKAGNEIAQEEKITVVSEDSLMKEKARSMQDSAKSMAKNTNTRPDSTSKGSTIPNPEDAPLVNLGESMQQMGLVNIKKIDPSIQVELKYSTKDNFMKEDVYGDLNDAYAQVEVAKMLAAAQKALKKEHTDLSLIVFDAARPFRVQKKMWEIVKNTPMKDYVAAPTAKGSMHNYGAAIDLSLIDKNGKLVDMGTPYDFLGALAQPKYEEKYIKEGKLTRQQVDNRLILRKAMEGVGFKVISNEWWHFNAYPDAVTLKKFKKII